MDSKKISFGFSKITKRSNLLSANKDKEKQGNKIQLIKCLEGQEIKLVEEKREDTPMIIPIKENTKTSAAIASLMKRRAILLGEADEPPPKEQHSQVHSGDNGNYVNETIEERAARELIASVQSNVNESIDQNLVLPTLKADELPLDGAKQSTIDDYDNVPIAQFGKAMLRGMGWTEPIQKKCEPPSNEMPFVRPKGMGLGADKALKKQPLLVEPEKNEVLEIKKQAYVRILGGKHKDMYGQIEGFDDHAGRVIVKMAIGGGKEAFNEFLCQPVSRKEYAQYGKCINTAKYEEYKKMENEHGQIIITKEENDNKLPTIKGETKGEYKKEDVNKRKLENRDRYKRDKTRSNDGNSEKTTTKNKYDNSRERFVHQSSRQRSDDRPSYHSNGNRVEVDRRRDVYRDSSARHYELDEQRSSNNRRESYDDRCKERDATKRRSREHSNRTEQEEPLPSASSFSRRQQYTDDTSASSGTDSDSDSAYERKLKKKSSHKSKSKKKSSKKSKRKQRLRTPDTETSTNSDSEDDEDSSRREKKQHKKKTKKSKKPRSRSRSHDRNSRR